MTKILGINAYHADASASLVVDGKVVVAIEEAATAGQGTVRPPKKKS